MMIEMIPGSSLIIPGDPPPRANLKIDYKLKGMPTHRIKNVNLRKQKERWDASNAYNDTLALLLRSQRNKHGLPSIPEGWLVFVHMIMFFSFKKSDNPADLTRDIDNAEKGVFDAIQKSGVIADDKQIVFKLVGKQVTEKNPRLEILSIAGTQHWSDFGPWMDRNGRLATERVYRYRLEGV